MNVEKQAQYLIEHDGLSNTLGMEFLSTPEPDTLMARMAVDDRTKQPFGFLSGGASLALAENTAGVGSMALCPDRVPLGVNVQGNHVQAMPYGGTVIAHARIMHQGGTLHVWQVDIKNEAGDLISTVQVTNYLLTPKK